MPAEGYALGIDFGTSNTVAVMRRGDERARPLLFDGSPILPSAVYLDPAGTILVGSDALQSARIDPARFEPNPKRQIDDTVILLGDRELPVADLITAVLRRVTDEARRTGGGDPHSLTLTCPAGWGATRRLVLSDAAQKLGLPQPTLIEEPVAAAAYFAKVLGRDVPIGSVVVVHDLGAGTFDASVVARTSSGFEVLAVDGRNDIGGIDIDQSIVEHIGKLYADREPAGWERLMKPSTVDDRRHRKMFLDDVRAAKERLSRQQNADLVIPLLDVEVHLTREELEQLAQPLLEQTVKVTQGVMRWAKLAEGRVAGVFLVGGSSRIPLMATLLHRAMGDAPAAIEQPELVVAEGSLVVGAAQPIAATAWVSGPPAAAAKASARVTVPEKSSGTPVKPATAKPATPPVQSAPPAAPASPAPVLANPVAANPAPASPAPASPAPPNPAPVSPAPVGPVYKAGRAGVPTKRATAPQPPPPAQRQPQYQAPPARVAPPPALVAQRQVRQQPYVPPAPAYRPKRGNPFLHFLKVLFITLLCIAVPIVSAYVAFKVSANEPVWPPDLSGILEKLGWS